MRMLFATTAGAGHFGPLIPLARAAIDAGHEVLVAAPTSFQASVLAAGLEFRSVGERSEPEATALFERLGRSSFEDGNAIMVRDGFAGIYARAALPAMVDLVERWRPDLVVREDLEFASLVAAEVHRVPHVPVATGLVSVHDYIRVVVIEPVEEMLQGAGADGGRAASAMDRPLLSLTPPSLEQPADRSRARRYRGRALQPPRMSRPDGLRPLVFLTFGSEAARGGFFPDLYRAAIGAVADGQVDVLVTLGTGGDPAALEPLPPGVQVERWVDQNEVLARADVVVCHGGYGTVVGSLAAGTPLVILPLFSMDQRLNAAAVARAGAGLQLEGPQDVGQLGRAVHEVLEDKGLGVRAREIAAEIAALPVPGEAIRLLEAAAASALPA